MLVRTDRRGLRRLLRNAALVLVLLVAGCSRSPLPEEEHSGASAVDPSATDAITGSSYLFVWAGDADGNDSDFLAVIDARPEEPSYGEIVATLPVEMQGGMPHHTEYEYPDGDLLFAGGWLASRSYLFDLRDPLSPKTLTYFDDLEGYSHPHSFARLKSGNVLATFQGRNGRYGPPGGLVEIDRAGNAVRAASALMPGRPEELAWPYSLAISPTGKRAVVAMAEMGMPPWTEFTRTRHVQIWDTDDLRLIAEVALPMEEGGWRHLDPAEPRFLADGTVYVATFSCGLYRIDGVEGERPQAEFVHGFPGGDKFENICAVPVVFDRYWIQTVAEINGLVVLDLSDPEAVVEVSRLVLDSEKFMMPHWVAADRKGSRIVVTGSGGSWVLVLALDPSTGNLSIDTTFAGDAGVSFDRTEWPHGSTGPATVHGALFGG